MLANLTTPLLGVVGTAVIGRLGQPHLLGAVAMSALIFDCIFWLFGFLRMGTVALTAQALGAGNPVEQRATLLRALLVAGAIGLALLMFQRPLASIVYGLMGGSAAVTDAAQVFFFVRVWSAPFALGNYCVLGWLIGLARTGPALTVQTFINGINMLATALLVLKFDLGVTGAALGSVIAEISGFAGSLVIVFILLRGHHNAGWATVLDSGRIMRMLAINRDIMIRTAALITAFLFFTAQGARSGDTILAANAVLHNLTLIGAFFLDGFAVAAEQLCGQSVGASDRTAFKRATGLIIVWGFAFGMALSAIFLITGHWLIDLMTASPDVRDVARSFLIFAVLAPIAGVLAFAFDGIYVGATWTREMRNLMILALLTYFAIWWAFTPLGNAGLWLAVLAFFLSRGLLQASRYPALLRTTFAV